MRCSDSRLRDRGDPQSDVIVVSEAERSRGLLCDSMTAEPLASNLRRELKEYVLDRLPRGVRFQLREARRRRRVRRIRDLPELDEALHAAYEAFQVSEADGRRALDSIEFVIDRPRPRDPATDAYRRNELAIYERLAGRPYVKIGRASCRDRV